MPTPPPPAEPLIAPEQRAEDAQLHRRLLNEVLDAAAGLLRLVNRKIDAQAQALDQGADPADLPDLTIPFERVARTIRRTIRLAEWLAEPKPAQPTPAQHRAAARQRVLRDVEDAIHREATGRRAETLHAELLERLDSPEFEDQLALRPIPDIVEDLRRDLGVAAAMLGDSFKRRTPDDIALLYARAARPPAPTSPPTRRRPVLVAVPPFLDPPPPEIRPADGPSLLSWLATNRPDFTEP